MIQPTLSDQNRSFWCQGWLKHQIHSLFGKNEAEKIIETTEVVEVIEAAEDPDAMDITQCVKCKQFLIFEAKEAVEVIEASAVIMSVEVIRATKVFKTTLTLGINKLLAKITFFWCFDKKNFWTEW